MQWQETKEQDALKLRTEAVGRDVAECTFKPEINKYSLRLSGNTSIMDRLQSSKIRSKENEAALRKADEEEMMKECTFKPKLVSRRRDPSPAQSRYADPTPTRSQQQERAKTMETGVGQ